MILWNSETAKKLHPVAWQDTCSEIYSGCIDSRKNNKLIIIILALTVFVFYHRTPSLEELLKYQEDLYLRALQPQYKGHKYYDSSVVISPIGSYCEDINFLVVVHIRTNSRERRDSWRKLYSNNGTDYHGHHKLLFVVGRPKLSDQQTLLEMEAKNYGDILQGDFLDVYKNMTLKHLFWQKYITESCPSLPFVAKFDDDVVWNITGVSEYIQEKINVDLRSGNDSLIYCRWLPSSQVPRWPTDKWYLPRDEYSETFFPAYCSGTGYIISVNALKKIRNVAKVSEWLWIDDVFVTGILREKASLKAVDLGLRINYVREQLDFPYKDLLFTLAYREDTDVWYKMLNPTGL